MIDVEQRPLRALEEDGAASRHLVGEDLARVAHVRAHALAELQRPLDQRLQLASLAAQGLDLRVGLLQAIVELVLQRRRLEEVADADPPAGYLVLVAGADSATGGADGLLFLAAGVDALVVRQDHVGVVAHHELRRVGEQPAAAEKIDLLHQRLGIDHHAVPDDALLARVQDAARDEVEHRLHAADHQRVPGVRPSLVTHHHVGPGGEEVDDLPLPFVAPLRADDHHVGHGDVPITGARRGGTWLESRPAPAARNDPPMLRRRARSARRPVRG